MSKYIVVVGNVGTVYDGDSRARAWYEFETSVEMSRLSYGRMCGESVTLFEDGEIIKEYVGPNDSN